jgi:hypothetical protein
MASGDFKIAEVTNGVDGTYYYYVKTVGTKVNTFQFALSGGSGTVTVTFEGTCDNTDPLPVNWIDITTATWGVATITASTIKNDNVLKLAGIPWVRIKLVASTGGANDADWTIYQYQRDEH